MARSPSSIRFPEDLRVRVAEQAAAERRTFSGEVLLLVERALEARTAAALVAEKEFMERLRESFASEAA